MRRRCLAWTLVLLSSCAAEKVEERSRHGDFMAVTYSWYEQILGPCPRYTNETRLYGPDDERLARHVGTLVDSPDGKWTLGYSSDPEGGLFVLDHGKKKLLWVKGCDVYLLRAVWSPDGARVLLSGSRRGTTSSGLQVLDVDGGEPRISRLAFSSDRTLPERESWSPNSAAFAFIDNGRYDKTLDLVEVQVVPEPKETARTSLERTDAGWTRYSIVWTDGRARALPR